MKAILFIFVLVAILFAKVDYSVMSTEELLAMIGYVPAKNQKAFEKEIGKRVGKMNQKQKTIYIKNLKKKR
ncbi:MAG: DUF1104 domain-containing protein [Sulfurospirillum sp.]